MILAAPVLAVILAQPVCWADRALPVEVKRDQLGVIADAIAEASDTPERAALLITIGYHESRWCIRVHAGIKRGGAGEGLWQLEGAHHGDGSRSGLSRYETADAALLASAQLDRSYQCGSSPAAILTAYAGRPCWQSASDPRYPGDTGVEWGYGWPTLTSRVRTYRWALGRIRG